MSIDSKDQIDFRRALWKEDSLDSSSSRSACASIIDKYRLDFKGKEPPRVPLCRLETFTRVRKLQLSSSQAEELKRSFRLNGYMESCHGFHVSPVDEDGNDVVLTQEEEDGWDFFWKSASQDFDRECRADPDFAPLVGKKFKVWDGNHHDAERTLQVLSTPMSEYKVLLGEKVYAELEESRKKTTTKEWYSDNMTVAAGAYIMSYSEVMAAQKELSIAEKEMEEKGTPWSESQKSKRWKDMLAYATRHWNSLIQKYATIVNPALGPEFMSTVRELQTTLTLQDKGKKDVKVEVGIDRIKAFASVPRDLKIKLLKVHYSSDAALRSASFHPQGNDLDSDIRPWLHQWAMWAMLETYCLSMLSSCVALQAGIVTEEVAAEEEEKFLKHFDSYRQKVWKTVWNSGKYDRHLIIDGRRAKRLFFRYAVWVRVFETLPACFTLWRLPPDETYSMFSNDDPFTTKWDDLADWERANCPFYIEQMESPVTMYDHWESHCYGRFQEFAMTEVALAESSQEPERILGLEAEMKTAQEKLQQVFDPRKLQSLSADECLAQAKEFEPRADQVVTTFTKLKRKKDDQTPKTPTIEVVEEAKDGGNSGRADSTPAAPKSNRRPRKKKAEIAPEVPAQNPSTEPVEAVEAVEAAVKDTGTAAETALEQAPEIRTAKRIKKKSAETKDFVNGEYRQDLQFAMEQKWVPVEASLGDVIHALRSKKQGAGSRAAVPALEALSSMCARLRAVGRRPKPFMIKNSKSDQGADLIMYDIPSDRAASPDSEVPVWNLFPAAANYPRHVFNLASKLLVVPLFPFL
ncbi:hypothetical protein R1sor_019027 [Riccia sorocarpa]|uniref:Uncharacterized protein n=1 Tax=Riccia sorocarpa TaxID=122646 RepID=A0ABD3IEZ7_9MARC